MNKGKLECQCQPIHTVPTTLKMLMQIEFRSNLCLNRNKCKKSAENFSNDWRILISDQIVDHRHSPAEHFDFDFIGKRNNEVEASYSSHNI